VAQGRIGRFGDKLTIKTELYNSKSGNLIASFTGSSKNIDDLLSLIDEKAPILFKKLPSVGGSNAASPSVESGISGFEKIITHYELDDEKRYLVNLSTEPAGAVLSFDGVPSSSCKETPCKAELREGKIRIIAALEQYETADTTISIKSNNQNIAIKLKPNFGILEIKAAYSDGIGSDKQWDFSINGKPNFLGEIRLSPNKYSVKLNHECYENVGFDVGINKGKREVFDMANKITLKKGGLALSAERDGEPVSEPVYVNGKKVGETPFSGTVPVCAKVEIGGSKEAVDVKLKHNEKVKHIHRFYEPVRNSVYTEDIERESNTSQYESSKFLSEEQTAWQSAVWLGMGGFVMMNSIDTIYGSIGLQMTMGLEFFKQNASFFRFGLNLDLGENMTNQYTRNEDAIYLKVGTFVKLYPSDFIYLLGGANYFGYYESGIFDDGIELTWANAFVFPVGVGLVLGSSDRLLLDIQYNIAMLKNGIGGYWSFNIGWYGSVKI
jgi:hypothetical protein